jgi:hypothetical protein
MARTALCCVSLSRLTSPRMGHLALSGRRKPQWIIGDPPGARENLNAFKERMPLTAWIEKCILKGIG